MLWSALVGCPWIAPSRHFGGDGDVRVPPASAHPGDPTDPADSGADAIPGVPADGELGAFDALEHRGDLDLAVVPGAEPRLDASGCPVELWSLVRVEVADGALSIATDPADGWADCALELSAPSLTRVDVLGDGDVELVGDWGLASATLEGTGELTVESVGASELDLTVRGTGDLAIAGDADAVTIGVESSGKVLAKDLSASTADIGSDGSGDVELRASTAAHVAIHASGDVTLWGFPSFTLEDDGSGELILR